MTDNAKPRGTTIITPPHTTDYLIPMGTGDRFFHGVVIDPSDEQGSQDGSSTINLTGIPI